MSTILFCVIIQELRRILPLKDFRLIENIARDVGNCSICNSISPRFMIVVKIRPSLYHVEALETIFDGSWDSDVCRVDECDLHQKVCESCELLHKSFSKTSYFSQMDFITDIRNARKTLVPI